MSAGTASEPLDLVLLRRLQADYARFVDAKDWSRLAGCLSDDFRFEGQWALVGPKAFVDRVRKQLATARTTHRLGESFLDLRSPVEAVGVWAFTDVIDDREHGSGLHRSGSGHYYESFRKLDGAWQIATMRIARVRVECSVFAGGVAVRTEVATDEAGVRAWLRRERVSFSARTFHV